METPLSDRMHKTIYVCDLSQGLWKSILDLWWSGGLFLATKGNIDKIWAWEQWFFYEKAEKKSILLTFLAHKPYNVGLKEFTFF